jgi:hypothetical protein
VRSATACGTRSPSADTNAAGAPNSVVRFPSTRSITSRGPARAGSKSTPLPVTTAAYRSAYSASARSASSSVLPERPHPDQSSAIANVRFGATSRYTLVFFAAAMPVLRAGGSCA